MGIQVGTAGGASSEGQNRGSLPDKRLNGLPLGLDSPPVHRVFPPFESMRQILDAFLIQLYFWRIAGKTRGWIVNKTKG